MSEAQWFKQTFDAVRGEVRKVIVGQDAIVEDTLVAMAAQGHTLLEGMPGLGKTLLVRTLANALSLSFSRIQFTPDMMPADVTGTNILVEDEHGHRSFSFKRGPIFGHVVLADEINRATPKTQAALLEAMQERAVTMGGIRHELPKPFLVMATQNPIEQEGTYPLPEAQLDRFMVKLLVESPNRTDLAAIVRSTGSDSGGTPQAVATEADLDKLRQIARSVQVADNVLDFGLSLVMGTRPSGEGSSAIAQRYARYGASPRGAQSLVAVAQAYALLAGRFNVSKNDLIRAAKPTLRHRVGLNYEAEADGLTVDTLLDQVIADVQSADRDPIQV